MFLMVIDHRILIDTYILIIIILLIIFHDKRRPTGNVSTIQSIGLIILHFQWEINLYYYTGQRPVNLE